MRVSVFVLSLAYSVFCVFYVFPLVAAEAALLKLKKLIGLATNKPAFAESKGEALMYACKAARQAGKIDQAIKYGNNLRKWIKDRNKRRASDQEDGFHLCETLCELVEMHHSRDEEEQAGICMRDLMIMSTQVRPNSKLAEFVTKCTERCIAAAGDPVDFSEMSFNDLLNRRLSQLR